MPPTIRHAGDAASYARLDGSFEHDLKQSGQGTLTVGTTRYRVSLHHDGLSVTPDNVFARLRHTFSARRPEKLQRLLTERLQSSRGAEARLEVMQQAKEHAFADRFSHIDIRSTSTLSPGEIDAMRQQAAYGFEVAKPIRGTLSVVGDTPQRARMQMVDTLNLRTGIMYQPVMRAAVFNLMGTAPGEGLLSAGGLPRKTYPGDDEGTAWRTFLAERIEAGTAHLDLFARLDTLRQALPNLHDGPEACGLTPARHTRLLAHGFDGEIRDVLLKNSPILGKTLRDMTPDAKERLLRELVEDVKTLLEKPTLAEQGQHLDRLITMRPQCGEIIANAMQTHFFRQTSKLGLEFFSTRGQGVKFWMQTLDGEKITDSATFAGTAQRRARLEEGYSEAITFSEMRHAMRLLQANPDADIGFLSYRD